MAAVVFWEAACLAVAGAIVDEPVPSDQAGELFTLLDRGGEKFAQMFDGAGLGRLSESVGLRDDNVHISLLSACASGRSGPGYQPGPSYVLDHCPAGNGCSVRPTRAGLRRVRRSWHQDQAWTRNRNNRQSFRHPLSVSTVLNVQAACAKCYVNDVGYRVVAVAAVIFGGLESAVTAGDSAVAVHYEPVARREAL
jgi:hypothetical protein